MAQIQEVDIVTMSRVADTPRLLAVVRNQQSLGGSFRWQRPKCKVWEGSLNVGMIGGKSLEVTNMMDRRKLEVLCVQEIKWKGDRARTLMGGYKVLHAGGDRKNNGVGIIVSEEISKNVVRVERWQRGIIVRNELAMTGTFFKKQESHRILYRSGQHKTELDLLVVRRQQMWRLRDCKIIAGEQMGRQHKPLDFVLRMQKRRVEW